MSEKIVPTKPLFLTEEETLAALDLFLMSDREGDPIKDAAMMKLTDLARRYMAEASEAEGAQEAWAATDAVASACGSNRCLGTAYERIVEAVVSGAARRPARMRRRVAAHGVG